MPKLLGFAPTPIPGPAPTPFLGHLPQVFRFFADPIGGVRRLRAYGDVVAVARDNPALVCAFGPERTQEVLTDAARFEHDPEFLRGREGSPLGKLSKVLVNINGEEHKRHRRLMMPAFSKSALDRYAADTVRITEESVARWPIGEVADLDALLRSLALAVSMRTLFGLDPDRRASPESAGVEELGELAVGLVRELGSPLTILLPYDLPGSPYRRASRIGGRVIAELERLIAEKRASHEVASDALTLLVRANEEGEALNDTELVCETLTLFIAGHETIAKTLTWTMFLLERHPDVLADVLDELDGALSGRSVTVEDELPLLDRVIKESMRLLTATPTLFLRVPKEATPLGRFTLPPKANVVISPHTTHHDPAIYPDPSRFDPERWSTFRPKRFEYLPFGAGPRMCIGATLSQQSLRLMLAAILPRVRIALVRGADISRLSRANILMPKHGMPTHLSPPSRRRIEPAPIRGDIHELVELPA